MTLTAAEYQAIIADATKRITGDIVWEGHRDAPW